MDLDPVADPLRPTRLGFDVSVLDECRFEHALGNRSTVRKGSPGISPLHAAFQQEVPWSVGLHQRGIGCHGGVDAEQGRLGCPDDRHLIVADRQYLSPHPDQRHDGLTAVTHEAVGQHGLVLDVGIDAEAVERHVCRRQHGRQPFPQRSEIAQRETGTGMRRSDDPDPERVGRNRIGAESVPARDLGYSIDT